MLLTVAFFEAGAACSLIVVATLPKPEPQKEAEAPAKPRGRKPTVDHAEIVDRLNEKGGRLEGTLEAIGEQLGLPNKSAAYRTLHALASAGAIALTTSAAGTSIKVL